MKLRYITPGNTLDLSIFIMSIVMLNDVKMGMPSWSLCQTEEVIYSSKQTFLNITDTPFILHFSKYISNYGSLGIAWSPGRVLFLLYPPRE